MGSRQGRVADMNAIASPGHVTEAGTGPGKGYFGRSLLVGALIEAGILGVVALLLGQKTTPPPPKPHPIAVHLVQPAPPKPKPKPIPPQPKPKPVIQHHPLPKPVPRPLPKPVIHHVRPRPVPLMAKTPAPSAPVMPAPKPVVTPPPPPPPPAPSASVQQAAVQHYAALVRSQIQAQTQVPQSVRMMGASGTAVIQFELLPSGQLVWARLGQSSGVGAIDRAALSAVKEGNYPPFTKNMPKKPTRFDVDVHLSARHGG